MHQVNQLRTPPTFYRVNGDKNLLDVLNKDRLHEFVGLVQHKQSYVIRFQHFIDEVPHASGRSHRNLAPVRFLLVQVHWVTTNETAGLQPWKQNNP